MRSLDPPRAALAYQNRVEQEIEAYLESFHYAHPSRGGDKMREVAKTLQRCPTCTRRCNGIHRCFD